MNGIPLLVASHCAQRLTLLCCAQGNGCCDDAIFGIDCEEGATCSDGECKTFCGQLARSRLLLCRTQHAALLPRTCPLHYASWFAHLPSMSSDQIRLLTRRCQEAHISFGRLIYLARSRDQRRFEVRASVIIPRSDSSCRVRSAAEECYSTASAPLAAFSLRTAQPAACPLGYLVPNRASAAVNWCASRQHNRRACATGLWIRGDDAVVLLPDTVWHAVSHARMADVTSDGC